MKIIALADLHYGFSDKTTLKIHKKFLNLLCNTIEDNDVDAIIIAGDLATIHQSQIDSLLTLYRTKINIPILIVYGNHDYWQNPNKRKRMLNMSELMSSHNIITEKHKVDYLGNGTKIFNDVKIYGYDGWYGQYPNSNDIHHMINNYQGVPIHQYMMNKSYNDCQNILDAVKLDDPSSIKTKICVSHFDCTPNKYNEMTHRGDSRHLEFLSEEFDLIIYGHTHTEINKKVGKSWIVAPGSCYNHPVGLILDTDKLKTKESPIIKSFKLDFTKPIYTK